MLDAETGYASATVRSGKTEQICRGHVTVSNAEGSGHHFGALSAQAY